MPSYKNQRKLWNNPDYVIILAIIVFVTTVIMELVD